MRRGDQKSGQARVCSCLCCMCLICQLACAQRRSKERASKCALISAACVSFVSVFVRREYKEWASKNVLSHLLITCVDVLVRRGDKASGQDGAVGYCAISHCQLCPGAVLHAHTALLHPGKPLILAHNHVFTIFCFSQGNILFCFMWIFLGRRS